MADAVALIQREGRAWIHGSAVWDMSNEPGLPSIHRITANRLLRAGIVRYHHPGPGVMPYLVLSEDQLNRDDDMRIIRKFNNDEE